MVKLTSPLSEITTLKSPALLGLRKLKNQKLIEGRFTVLTEEATDVSNVQQVLIFIRYYDSEKNATDTCLVNTSDVLFESENTAPDTRYI